MKTSQARITHDYGYIDGHCGVILDLILTCKKRKIPKMCSKEEEYNDGSGGNSIRY